MRLVGLTGGLCTGKSTVARMLRARRARVIDADRIAREVVQPGQPAYRAILRRFGRSILRPDRHINRRTLARLAFPRRIRELNAIVHPQVRAEMRRRIRAIARRHPSAVVALDVPLWFETGFNRWVRETIVVTCTRAQQIARARARGWTALEARRRMQAQWPLERKVRRATWVIQNTGRMTKTQRQVNALWALLKKKKLKARV